MSYHYKIACRLSMLKDMRKFVRTTLREYLISDLEISAVVLALDEMCSNLIIHAHHCNPEHLIDLYIFIPNPKLLIFEIIDDGSMFDINLFHEAEITSLIHEKRKGGLGIRLVKSIMDKIEYVKEDNRYICRLTKNVF